MFNCGKCGKSCFETLNGIGPCCDVQLADNIIRRMEDERAREEKRFNLLWALRTRIITDEEMKLVEQMGFFLVVSPRETFNINDAERFLNDCLLLQFRMRIERERMEKSLVSSR